MAMSRFPSLHAVRALRSAHSSHPRIRPRSYASKSQSPPPEPANRFNKTGERETSPDPTRISVRSDEYSKSGGDDIVAEQEFASFKDSKDTDPASQKARAGKGNVINPLDASPASPEISAVVEERYVVKNVEREPSAKTGKGVVEKARKVERVEIDFEKMRMTRR